MEIQENDILVFKNGNKKEYTSNDKWLFENFYDKDLVCITSDKFTIMQVLRPHYEVIYNRGKVLKKAPSGDRK